MDLTMRTADLANELALIERVVPRRPTIPSLTCAHLTAHEDGKVTLVGTDARVGIVSRAGRADVAVAGSSLVPAAKLSDLVRSLPGDAPIRLRSDGVSVRLTASGYVGVLQTFDVQDFPAVPEPEVETLPRIIPSTTLLGLVRRTRYAISGHEDARGVITGALLECDGTTARVVATDGHRLSVAEAVVEEGAAYSSILSQLTIEALVAAFDEYDGPVEVCIGARHVFASGGERTVFGQLIEGTFPAWRKIVPTYEVDIAMPRQALIDALRRARLIADASRVALRFGVEVDSLRVSAVSASVGSGDETIAAAYDGLPVEIGLNAGYVLDYLEAMSGDTVRVQFKTKDSPFVMRSADGGSVCTGVVMPVRL